jgi:hypothetical protein
MENTSSCGFSTGPYCQDHLTVVDKILDSGGLATRHICGLEFTELLYLVRSAGEIKVTPHANLAVLHSSITAKWDQLVVEYICKTCCSFRRRL